MTKEELNMVVHLLEQTLGDMPSSNADGVVEAVVEFLKTKLPTS